MKTTTAPCTRSCEGVNRVQSTGSGFHAQKWLSECPEGLWQIKTVAFVNFLDYSFPISSFIEQVIHNRFGFYPSCDHGQHFRRGFRPGPLGKAFKANSVIVPSLYPCPFSYSFLSLVQKVLWAKIDVLHNLDCEKSLSFKNTFNLSRMVLETPDPWPAPSCTPASP